MDRTYKGFSTSAFKKTKSFRVFDVDVVREDLLNHMFTARGSRVMMPKFGSHISFLAFEPLDDTTVTEIEQDIRSVIEFDPRVRLRDLAVIPVYEESSIIVAAVLDYIELKLTGRLDLKINFET